LRSVAEPALRFEAEIPTILGAQPDAAQRDVGFHVSVNVALRRGLRSQLERGPRRRLHPSSREARRDTSSDARALRDGVVVVLSALRVLLPRHLARCWIAARTRTRVALADVLDFTGNAPAKARRFTG